MAFINDIQNFEAGLVARMRKSFDMVRRNAIRNKVYRTTLQELNSLSQRELDDLGIARESIQDIARDAARSA